MLLILAKLTAGPLLWLLLRPKIVGRRPTQAAPGGAMLVYNHISRWDGILMALCFPFRRIHFLMRDMPAWPPLYKRFLAGFGMYALTGQEAVDRMCALLTEGKTVGLTPEGRISSAGAAGRFHTGAARIALKTHAPIIPVCIQNRPRALRRTRVKIGAPVYLSDWRTGRDEPSHAELMALSERLRRIVAAMADERP